MPLSRDPRPAERLVAAYASALAVAAARYPSLPADEREVVVQDAYLRVLLRLEQGPLEDPVTYLLRVVGNTGGGLLRKRGRLAERTAGLPAAVPEVGDDIAVDVDRSLAPLTPEEHAISRAETALVWRVLTTELSERERLVLVRRRVEWRRPAEIAAELGTTERGYRHILQDAGQKLAAGVFRARVRELTTAGLPVDTAASDGDEGDDDAEGRVRAFPGVSLRNGPRPRYAPSTLHAAA